MSAVATSAARNALAPSLIAGGVAVVSGGLNNQGWFSGRNWRNAGELVGSLIVGEVLASWIVPGGLIGLSRSVTGSVIGGLGYAGIRSYLDKDKFLNSAAYGIGLGLTGDILIAPFNLATGLIVPGNSGGSNISTPPGTGLPFSVVAGVNGIANVSPVSAGYYNLTPIAGF